MINNLFHSHCYCEIRVEQLDQLWVTLPCKINGTKVGEGKDGG